MKKIEMTGSPKPFFKTKSSFLTKLSEFGFEQDKMKSSEEKNEVMMLVTNDLDSDTSKMQLAKKLGIEIKTYEELVELFELECDE
jgi:hypothetical protein